MILVLLFYSFFKMVKRAFFLVGTLLLSSCVYEKTRPYQYDWYYKLRDNSKRKSRAEQRVVDEQQRELDYWKRKKEVDDRETQRLIKEESREHRLNNTTPPPYSDADRQRDESQRKSREEKRVVNEQQRALDHWKRKKEVDDRETQRLIREEAGR